MRRGQFNDSNDLMQQVAVRIIRAQERISFESDEHLMGYAFRAAKSVLIDEGRMRAKQPMQSSSFEDFDELIESEEADLWSDPEVKQIVDFFISTMSAREREIFELVVLEGLDSRIAAEKMGITEASARSLLRHVRLRFKTAMYA